MTIIKMKVGNEYTINEVAEYCNLDRHTVWRAVWSASLSARWDTRHTCWMILFEDVLSWRKRVDDRKKGKQSKESEDDG
jgi:hypothetical protein